MEASVSRSMDLQRRLESATVETLLKVMPKSCQLLEFLVFSKTDFSQTNAPKEECYAALRPYTSTEVDLWDCGKAEVMNQKISKFRILVQRRFLPNTTGRRADFDRIGCELFDLLLRPVQGRSLKHLFIAADGELSCVPFAALPLKEGGFLADLPWTTSFLLSGRDLLGTDMSATSQEPVVVADPHFAWKGAEEGDPALLYSDWDRNLHFCALEGTRHEGIFVHDLLGGTLLLGEAATVKRFKNIESPRVLHVATHGFFLQDQPGSTRLEAVLSQTENPYLRSGLALAGAQAWQEGFPLADSGVITAQEIRGMRLQGTKLAVLSACDTGRGEIRRGQGVLGLARAFLIAGARAVVMSLWQVTLIQRQLSMFMLF